MIDPKVEAALRRLWDRTHDDEAHELLATIRAALSQTPNPQTTQPKCAVCGLPMLMTETLIFGGGLNPTHHKRCGGQTPNPQRGETEVADPTDWRDMK